MNRRQFLRSLAASLGVIAGAGGIAALAPPAAEAPALTREAFDRFLSEIMAGNAKGQAPIFWCHPRHLTALIDAGVPHRFIRCYERPP